jgi:hypothetical protein
MNNENSQTDKSAETFVIGQQIANAYNEETIWRESEGQGVSPLPDIEYDFWRGDFSLIAPNANPLDDEIRRVCKQYSMSTVDERYKIRHSISMDQFYTLINFSKRSAVFGVRYVDPAFVSDGLTAIAMIEKNRVDFRDILWCLSLLYHASNKVGGFAEEMFRSTADLAEPDVAKLLVNFLQQTPEYRDLRNSWGYDEVQTDAGVGFIGWGFHEYNPSIDLKQTIIAISKLVASDIYQPSQIEVATTLPDIWLGVTRSSESKNFLSCVRAGAMLSANLKPAMHPEHNCQQFTIFIAETAKESDAQVLNQMASNNKSTSHCKLALVKSRLFCLVVARSFVEGVAGYETNESLMRFSDGLGAILERHAGIEQSI